MASVRHQLYKYNDGATGWELQRLINGYNDRRDRAWPPCQITNMKNKFLGICFLALGLDLQSMVESRASWSGRRESMTCRALSQPEDPRRPHDCTVGRLDHAN